MPGISRTFWHSRRVPLLFLLLTSLSLLNAPTGRRSAAFQNAQGSAVPGATVAIRNQATGVDTTLVTNDGGAYTSPPSCWDLHRQWSSRIQTAQREFSFGARSDSQ